MIRFPSGTVDSLSCFLSIPHNLLNASPLSPGGLTMQSIDGSPSGLPFAGYAPFVRNLCLRLNLPIINTANIIPLPNPGVGVIPSVSYAPTGCPNPVLCYPTSVTQTAHSVIGSGPSDPSVHTIVRGPVMYTSASSHDLIQRSNGIHSSDTKIKEESPPDRIVASYAAAAHAAALACHQPISRAAEAYLATNSYNRSRHSKRPRASNYLATVTISTTSNTLSTSLDTRSNYISSSNLSFPSTESSSEATYEESHKGWTRLVNKKAQNVVYITSDGTRLHNVDEVYTYLSTKNSECEINSSIKELIAAHFIFAPTIDGPSLEDTLNFVHRLHGSVLKDESVRDSVSQFLTTVSSSVNSSDSVSQAVKSSEEVSTCRITFNPDYSPNSDLLSAKRSKLSDDLLSSDCKIKEPSILKGQSVNCLANATSSACSTQSFVSSNNCELNILCTDTLHTSSINQIREGPSSFENNQFTHKQNLNNLSKTGDEYFATSSSSVFHDDISSSRIKQSQLQNDSEAVAKLTTETLTTGALRTSLASLTTEVVPSVISPSKQIGLNATNFSLSGATSSCFNPSQTNLAALNVVQQNSVNPLFMEQLLGISQMRHIQHPQQHNHLSSGITVTVPTQNIIENYPLGVLASQSLSNPLLSSLTTEWLSNLRSSTQQSTTSSTLPELTLNSVIENLNATSVLQQYQQRHLLTLAALQKHQQNQALALIQNAVLLQQQQRNNNVANAAALVLRQQQEQQLAVASLQAQNYIAALQRQLTNSHT
uniref:MBD domain-containing protein n=2 Tax=Schistosoma mansoni TaxID=6183 RepID=A0A3Q0KNC5_SCHMA